MSDDWPLARRSYLVRHSFATRARARSLLARGDLDESVRLVARDSLQLANEVADLRQCFRAVFDLCDSESACWPEVVVVVRQVAMTQML